MLGGIGCRRRRGRQRMRCLDGITDSMHMSLGELWASDSSERLLQRNKEGTVQSSSYFTKAFLLLLRSWCHRDKFSTCLDIVVQCLSHVWLFTIPWITAHQSFMSFAISQSLLKLMSIESMMPSNHLILYHPFSCCLLLFPASELFLMCQFFPLGGQVLELQPQLSPSNEY